MAKILGKYTDEEFLRVYKNWRCWQVTTDAFTFPKEIIERTASLFWVLEASKEMK